MSQATLGSAPYQNSNLFSGYYLDERIYDLDSWDCDEEAEVAFEDLKTLWELEGGLVDSYKEDELLDEWIDEVLDVLGFGTKSEATLPDSGGYNDRLLFSSDEERREAAERVANGETDADYKLASAVLEAKQWGADFTQRFSEARSYRDASHQIKYYLEHTPETLNWGILTDGRKWRLYGTKDYATEIYYEVDLPELLSTGTLEQFKYFYAFFRSEAFREVGGASFLDTVWNESETAAQELGEDLQDNVFTALRVLGEGFVHQNDLDIDPEDESARGELKEQSLVLLYRLMFVLYAESRGLIRPDDEDARDEYEEHFSLDQLRAEIHDAIQEGDTYEDYSGYSTKMWSQLQDLFELVDEGNKELDIPPYNGGLFDDDEHEFLAEHEVADRHIAEVVHRLGTTAGDDGGPVLADYADLDTRHLGSIYEGLLEHEFRIAGEQYAAVSEDGGQVWKPATEVSVADAVETVEEGELYVVNDDGERKATGAYYTPDYVVSYIVEETVDPLLDDIKSELEADGLDPSDQAYFGRFYRQVQELKILDPAMGSAHFLSSATAYLTEQVMEVAREHEQQGRDERGIRRTIAKECIYGVDVNGMAVELGKLSMWLETLAADQPLAFLDHHLKAGNSLVGSDITEVLSDDVDEEGGQLTLMQVAARARKDTLEHVMELMQDLLAIDNQTLDDIKSMEELYDEIRDDPLYQRLFEIANVHTAEEFGLDVPAGVYEEMAGAIEDADEWGEIQGEDWFESAQAMADKEDFFHWELEYPEVFFGENGEKREDAGFDAVVGNPPYVVIEGPTEDYLRDTYDSPHYFVDLYHVFIEKGIDLCRTEGGFGYIVPEPWLTQENTEPLRKVVLENSWIRRVTQFDKKVFADATVDTITLHLQKTSAGEVEISQFHNGDRDKSNLELLNSIPQEVFSKGKLKRIEVRQTAEEQSVLRKITDELEKVQDVAEVSIGIQAYNRSKHSEETIESRAFHADHKATEDHLPQVSGQDVSRYLVQHDGETWVKYGPHLHDYRPMKYFSEPRILVREITNSGRYKIHAAYTGDEICNYKTVLNILPKDGYSPFYVLSIINSSLLSWVFPRTSNKVVSDTFPRISVADIKDLPLPAIETTSDSIRYESELKEYYRGERDGDTLLSIFEGDAENADVLTYLGKQNTEFVSQLKELNQSLLDHLGSYSDGQTLADIGLTQPPKGSADSILQQTTEEKPNLRVGEASVERESPNTVEIRLTARYKPDDEDAHETDQWGYTETEPLPALRITDLTETEADLVEAFVPVTVDDAGGFAGFRETATKTNSLVDRLRKLTLPAIDDVREGLESYTETVERADELEAKIERTDDLIDEIVYELYGLTDEEIEIVEETVAG